MYDYSTLTLTKKQLQNLNRSFGQYEKYYRRLRLSLLLMYDDKIVFPNFMYNINHHYKGLIEHG